MFANRANQEKFDKYWNDQRDYENYENDDIRQMIDAAARKFGIVVTPLMAYTLWSGYSDSMSAGWLVYSEEEWLAILESIIND